ncbi:hypothetical protein HK102_003765 [Quaeritorhiza haematococci]|nr:hypothetical protein HK102_003765 [Quaeritorhiza haematococci]
MTQKPASATRGVLRKPPQNLLFTMLFTSLNDVLFSLINILDKKILLTACRVHKTWNDLARKRIWRDLVVGNNPKQYSKFLLALKKRIEHDFSSRKGLKPPSPPVGRDPASFVLTLYYDLRFALSSGASSDDFSARPHLLLQLLKRRHSPARRDVPENYCSIVHTLVK